MGIRGNISKFKLAPQFHLNHPWKVHSLLEDFRLEEVWQVPVILQRHHSLQLFLAEGFDPHQPVPPHSLAWYLFRTRVYLGRFFRWDPPPGTYRSKPSSLRQRFAHQQVIEENQLPEPGSREFKPVYQLENELLVEIENKTVHAALHVGRVPWDDDDYTIQVAIYVKPKGALGEFYMRCIKPFRHRVVYPALIKAAKARWQAYLIGL